MRKFLAYLPILALTLLVTGVIFVPHVAHAADVAGTVLNWFGFGIDALYGLIGKVVWWTLVPLTSFVLNLVGQLIDLAITLSLSPDFYASQSVTTAWGIIRDICNIFFIFVLIFTGVRTILGLDTGETRRIVVSVIIGAVLINFSLFLTKAAIDVSNIFTAWITQGIKDLGGGDGVSNSAIAVLKMQQLATSQGSISNISNWNVSTFASGLALVTLNCIAIYVFFKVAFLMLGRLVSFILLLIMSPIGFVGHLVPRLDAYAKDWRDELTKACLMAPMFLLLLYITLFLATKFDAVLGQFKINPGTNALVGANFGIAEYALFAIIAIMLLKSLKVAEDYTGAVAGQVGGLIKNAAGIAVGGGIGIIGRATTAGIVAGANAKAAEGSVTPITLRARLWEGVKGATKATIPPGIVTQPSRWVGAAKDAAKGGTWDVRNLAPEKSTVMGVISGKDTLQKSAKDIKEEGKKWAEERGLLTTEVSLLEELTKIEEEKKILANAEVTLTAAIAGGSAPAIAAAEAARDTAKDAVGKREDKISSIFYKTSNKDLEKLNVDKVLTNKTALGLMSTEQVMHLKDKSELPGSVKSKITGVREADLVEAMTAGSAPNIEKALKKLSKKELETLSSGVLTHANISSLATPEALEYNKLDTIMKSDAIGPGTKNRIRDARYKTIKDRLSAGPGTLADILTTPAILTPIETELARFKSETEISKMNEEILKDPRVTLSLSTQALSKVAEELSASDRAVMRQTIEDAYSATVGARPPVAAVGNVKKLYDWVTNNNRGKQF